MNQNGGIHKGGFAVLCHRNGGSESPGILNKAKNFFQQFHDKLENFLFWIIQNLPENLIPAALINWTDQYLDKRIQYLKQEILHQNWNKAHLDQALKEIRSRQQVKEKAPSGK